MLIMTNEFEICDIITGGIKQEYEEVIVSETTININNTELNDYEKYESNADSRSECSFLEKLTNVANENNPMKEEAINTHTKTIFNNKWLICSNCYQEYQDYCTKCGMLEHILNRNTFGSTFHKTEDGIPSNILEMRKSSGHFGIFTLKIIPKGVKFGPYTGVYASDYSCRIKEGRFMVSDDRMTFLNWMQYINSTEDISKQNLFIFQYEGNIYYRSNREIEEGEELLVGFGEEYKVSLDQSVEMEFNPTIDWEVKDVFACTLCCLGFSSKLFLSEHKTICPYKSNEQSILEELTRCPFCKIYLEKREYLDNHITHCDGNNDRKCAPSPVDLETLSSALKERKKRQPVLHKCRFCTYKTAYKTEMKLHRCEILHVGLKKKQTHIKEKNYKCKKCEYQANHKSRLKRHIKAKHTDRIDYSCPECEYKTNYKHNLETHIKGKHVGEKVYKCTECEYKTSYKSGLRTHIEAKHVNEGYYTCTECEYKTGYKLCLQRHIKAKHIKEKDYECTECEYKTSYKGSMREHMKLRHFHDKKYKCAECEFKTSKKSLLERHINAAHTLEKLYNCAECEYKTGYKENLEAHIKGMHVNEKDYECSKCDYRTSYKGNLKKHIKARHMDEKSYKCAVCDFKTSYKSSLIKHSRGKHIIENNPQFI